MLTCDNKHIIQGARPGDACPACKSPLRVYVPTPALHHFALAAITADGHVVQGEGNAPDLQTMVMQALAQFNASGIIPKIVSFSVMAKTSKIVSANGTMLPISRQ
jgi:hypothetical protein